MEADDRAALDRLKRDQEYRDWLQARRRAFYRRLAIGAPCFAAFVGAAVGIAQLIRLL